jgi:putative hydrolase of the HAD superfamily
MREKIKTPLIKHVLFDLDGTLYSSKSGIEYQIVPLIVKHTALVLSIAECEAKVLLRNYRQEFKSTVLGLQKYHNIDPVKFFETVYNDINVETIRKYDGLQDNIELLSKGMSLHLLTNSNRTHANRILKKLGLFQYFTNIFSVENANFIRKPEPIAYLTALKNISAKPNELVTIDDSYLNLVTANNLGISTILVSNGISKPPLFWEMHEKIYHEAPNFVLGSYQNINNAIEALL